MKRRAARGGRFKKTVVEPDNLEQAKSTALDILSRRSITSKGLEEKLTEKGFTGSTSSSVVLRLEDLGLLNDLEYARAFVRGRTGTSPKGFILIKKELLARGVPKDTAQTVIAEAREETSEVDIAERLAEKKIKTLRGVSGDRAKTRVFSYLLGRGIPRNIAIQVIRKRFAG